MADDDDFDPHQARNLAVTVSSFGTLLHFLKGSIGTGILAMPKGFTYSGIILGTIATFGTALLCSYGLNLLIASEYILCKRKRVGYLTYSEAMSMAVEEGPKKLRWFAKTSGYLVNGFLVAYQLGMCSVYIIFVSRNLKLVVDSYDCDYLNLPTYMCILLVLFFLINLVPNLKIFVVFSGIATLMMLAGFGIICYYIFSDLPPASTMSLYGNPARWVMFIGICLFAIESVGVVVHAENKMTNPHHFAGFFGVLNVALIIVAFLYWFLGFFGYWKYGEHVSGSITLDLPASIISQVAQLLFAGALIISFGLQCFPAIDIIWNVYIFPRFGENASKLKLCLLDFSLRTTLVFITFGLAMAFSNYLSIFIGFIGVVCLSMLGFSFPAFMHLCVVYPDNYGRGNWIFFKDLLLVFIGLFLLVLGTYSTIDDIIQGAYEQTPCVEPTLAPNTTIAE